MEAALTWLDLTTADRDRMRRLLDLFSEKGTVDELGLGVVRDMISDALFPGTSTIQTRLRYFLFIPWIYRDLEDKNIDSPEIEDKAREREISLIRSLCENGDEKGVIGARSRSRLRRLPSAVYWAGLIRWGIFSHHQSLAWYHRNFSSLKRRRHGYGTADDPGVVWTREPNWHRRLPEKPQGFPWEASFDLTDEEAEFLKARIEDSCPNTFLSFLVERRSSFLADDFWDREMLLGLDSENSQIVEMARRFSLHVEGAPLVYNLLLAEKRHRDQAGGDEELIEDYRIELQQWAEEERGEDPFQPDDLWDLMARQGARTLLPLRKFIEAWTRGVNRCGASSVVNNRDLRDLIARREIQLKGNRARLVHTGRLMDWSGRVGVGRMDFRWHRVRPLLQDLYKGLAN